MENALILLAVLGAIGAFDTAYYHEYRARLPAMVPLTAPELKLHAFRDFLYAILFSSLPWVAWHGGWVVVLTAILLGEIVLTMRDFVVEITVRKPLGDVYAGERVAHAVMAIVYGAMLANLLPVLPQWWSQATAFTPVDPGIAPWLRWLITLMGIGVFLSGTRDLYAAHGLPGGGWPWRDASRQIPAKDVPAN